MRERNTPQRATLSTVTIILICFHCLALSISIHLEYTRTMGGICSKHTHIGLVHVCLRSTVTYSVHNNSTPQILLFQESHLISYWPMKQWRVRGKWTINLCNVIHGLSAVSKCLHRQPSKPAVKRILQKRNLSRAGLSLYLSPARQQQGIKHIIFQRSVHFSYRLAFYVLCTPAQGRTAVWAPHPL